MAQFVIIRGPVNSGKSTTTQLVYKYLAPMADIGSQHLFRHRMENPFDVLVSPEVPKYVSGNSQYDFYAILTIQGKKIGIASAGDTMDKVKAAVDEFLLQHNVDIVVCCTHSYDKKGSAYRMLKNMYSPFTSYERVSNKTDFVSIVVKYKANHSGSGGAIYTKSTPVKGKYVQHIQMY